MNEGVDENKDLKRAALSFIVLMGVVSLFSDMTHEGGKSILGAYLSLTGASAAVVGFVSGFGELVGYSLRCATGRLADRTKRYWLLTIVGYAVDLLAVPALALVPENGWLWAAALIVVERAGKAVKKPAKDTLLSFAAAQNGVGRSFALQEFLDQLGAFLGPVALSPWCTSKVPATALPITAAVSRCWPCRRWSRWGCCWRRAGSFRSRRISNRIRKKLPSEILLPERNSRFISPESVYSRWASWISR